MDESLFSKELAKKAGELISGMMNDYMSDIEKAYFKSDDKNGLAVSFKVKIAHDKKQENTLKLDADLSFIAEKVTDSAVGYVSHQMSLEESPRSGYNALCPGRDHRGFVLKPGRSGLIKCGGASGQRRMA